MKSVFVDTSALIALLCQNDEFHETASRIMNKLCEDETIMVTSNYVINETIALIQRRISVAAACDFIVNYIPILKINFIDEIEHNASNEFFLARRRSRLSFTDCSSFIVMTKLKISTAFCFDKHFHQAGFKLVKC